jgi:hypothetical protein
MLKFHRVWKFAAAGLALMLSWPAAAQTVTFCDSSFATGWTIQLFSGPTGSTVTPSNPPTGGSGPPSTPCGTTNTSYRDVADAVVQSIGGVESVVYGVHIFSPLSYNPAISGAIGSIDFSMDYECPDTSGSCVAAGQAFGPALQQGNKFFVAYTPGQSTGVTGQPPSWKPFASTPLTATAFSEITVTSGAGVSVVINPNSRPDFSNAGKPIQCGFYTGNATSGGAYTINAGYDNWQCVITPTPPLKICKVAGPGVITGTPSTFTYASTVASGSIPPVPAGPAPGGTCVLGPRLPMGTSVTVTENIPPGNSVSSIAVAPTTQIVGTANLAAGKVTVAIGSGITEVTYTDQAPTGYLEICKHEQNVLGTSPPTSAFTVNPGNMGPIAVPAGACSPAFQVPAGQVVIQEAASPGVAMAACTTIPANQQIACQPTAGTSTVNVVAGGISTQTVAIITNNRQTTGTLTIKKLVSAPPGGILPNLTGVVFPVNVVCTPSGPSTSVTLTAANPSQVIPNILVPSTCNVAEQPLTSTGTCPRPLVSVFVPPPTYVPGQNVTITVPPAAPIVEVHNVIGCVPVASSACVLDPGMVAASNTFARRATLAQTFTPTQSGSLTTITHGLETISGSVTNYDLLVTTTTGGLPSWTGGPYIPPNVLLAMTGVTIFSTSGLVNGSVPIPAGQQPHLIAGTQYALILIPGAPAAGFMAWRGNSGAGSYPNGSAYELNGTTWTVPGTGPKDHGFKLDGQCP